MSKERTNDTGEEMLIMRIFRECVYCHIEFEPDDSPVVSYCADCWEEYLDDKQPFFV